MAPPALTRGPFFPLVPGGPGWPGLPGGPVQGLSGHG